MVKQNKSRNNRNQTKSRRNRRNQNKSRRNRRQNGGAYNAGALSLAQGQQYRELHKNQYGGGQAMNPAPVGDTGMLDPSLRQMAAVGPLDRALGEVAGMSDMQTSAPEAPAAAQKGGRRKQTKSRKNKNKKSKMSKKSKKSKSKKQRGGAYSPAPVSAPGMLLSRMDAARAGTADFSNPWLTK
jgi:hypothetical protein